MAKNKMKRFRNKQTGENIYYISQKDFKNRFSERNVSIVGEINVAESDQEGMHKKILGKETTIVVRPVGTYAESKYRTDGYILCAEDEFVVVKKRKIYPYVLAALILLLIIAALLVGKYFWNKGPDIDPNAGNYSSALQRPDDISKSQILIPGYKTFTIEKGNKTINTAFYNPEGNPCFFKYTLVEEGTGDILYESKLIPPGQGISPIKINKVYKEVGSYAATLKFQTYDLDKGEQEYNGSEIEVVINVVDEGE